MHIIEITAAELADRLVEGGTKFEMEPDRVIWPDGTITKKASPPRGKKTKKMPPAVSKHGLYGTIVAQFGNKKKSATASANNGTSSNIVTIESTPSSTSTDQTESRQTPEKPKQARRCKFLNEKLELKKNILVLIIFVKVIFPVCTWSLVWKTEEHVDLLVIYKNMLLSGLKKDNFKELSKRMSEVGWDRNNDQCRQQVNADSNLLEL